MTHWPAVNKWLNPHYFLKLAGTRTVPVEIGSHYADENWSQKLMTMQEFVMKYFMSESGEIGYLAQHNLFDQVLCYHLIYYSKLLAKVSYRFQN